MNLNMYNIADNYNLKRKTNKINIHKQDRKHQDNPKRK